MTERLPVDVDSREHTHAPGEDCWICRHEVPFSLPEQVVEAAMAGRLVVFAGAGISTESRTTFPVSFYESVCDSIGLDPEDGPPFETVMSQFCERYSRSQLLQAIRSRIEYCSSYPGVYRMATRFHHELSTIHLVKEVVTTNWDDFFEKECGAIPMVVAADYAFWDLPQRKVFKIHGSLNNVGSIVATEDDYRRCYRNLRSGVLGATLKHLLATKTVLFVGFSFSDPDFGRIYRLLQRQLGDVLPPQFIVTRGGTELAARFPAATVIDTDGTFFVSTLKNELVARGAMLPDENLVRAGAMYAKVADEHIRFTHMVDVKEHPEAAYAAAYQDGLRDAFARILALANTGFYSDRENILGIIDAYDRAEREKRRARGYGSVAYIEGFVNGHVYLLDDEEDSAGLPLYFIHGCDKELLTFDDYADVAGRAHELHKTAFRYAERAARRLEPGVTVLHHPPFL